MNNRWNFFNNKWFLRGISLVLALILFFYVNSSKTGFLRQNTRSHDENSALMSNKTAVIKTPLDITTDNRYVVTGYPKYVQVTVKGPSALVTTTSNTQNFKAYIDITSLGVGNHKVKVKTSGLNSELRATVKPTTVTVNIQPRKTVTKKISVQLSSHDLSNGYQVGTPKTDISSVQVSGATDEVNKVSRVIAFVSMPTKATSDIHRTVTLQAVDKSGKTLNVVIEPTTTNVTIPINSSSNGSSESSSSASSSSDDESEVAVSSSSSSTKAKDRNVSSSNSSSESTD